MIEHTFVLPILTAVTDEKYFNTQILKFECTYVLHKGFLMQDWVFTLGWWSYLDPQNDCFKKLQCTGLLIDLGKVILFGGKPKWISN